MGVHAGKTSDVGQLVFNRYGEKMFESNSLDFKWDGTFRNQELNPAVFVYYMQVMFKDNHYENGYKGSVTLIR